ncbi:hypothetical protein CYMTET_51280, partial [Cymbomonas tetramitiformis]
SSDSDWGRAVCELEEAISNLSDASYHDHADASCHDHADASCEEPNHTPEQQGTGPSRRPGEVSSEASTSHAHPPFMWETTEESLRAGWPNRASPHPSRLPAWPGGRGENRGLGEGSRDVGDPHQAAPEATMFLNPTFDIQPLDSPEIARPDAEIAFDGGTVAKAVFSAAEFNDLSASSRKEAPAGEPATAQAGSQAEDAAPSSASGTLRLRRMSEAFRDRPQADTWQASQVEPPNGEADTWQASKAEPPNGEADTWQAAQAEPPNGEADTWQAAQVEPPNGEADTWQAAQVGPPNGEVHTWQAAQVEPPNGEADTWQAAQVEPPNGEAVYGLSLGDWLGVPDALQAKAVHVDVLQAKAVHVDAGKGGTRGALEAPSSSSAAVLVAGTAEHLRGGASQAGCEAARGVDADAAAPGACAASALVLPQRGVEARRDDPIAGLDLADGGAPPARASGRPGTSRDTRACEGAPEVPAGPRDPDHPPSSSMPPVCFPPAGDLVSACDAEAREDTDGSLSEGRKLRSVRDNLGDGRDGITAAGSILVERMGESTLDMLGSGSEGRGAMKGIHGSGRDGGAAFGEIHGSGRDWGEAFGEIHLGSGRDGGEAGRSTAVGVGWGRSWEIHGSGEGWGRSFGGDPRQWEGWERS